MEGERKRVRYDDTDATNAEREREREIFSCFFMISSYKTYHLQNASWVSIEHCVLTQPGCAAQPLQPRLCPSAPQIPRFEMPQVQAQGSPRTEDPHQHNKSLLLQALQPLLTLAEGQKHQHLLLQRAKLASQGSQDRQTSPEESE